MPIEENENGNPFSFFVEISIRHGGFVGVRFPILSARFREELAEMWGVIEGLEG